MLKRIFRRFLCEHDFAFINGYKASKKQTYEIYCCTKCGKVELR